MNMQIINNTINLSEFSRDPTFIYRQDGDFSAVEFRDEHVIPQLDKLQEGKKITITLDGTRGISPSFLEEGVWRISEAT